jgi:hydroxypyruvate reductase
VRSALSRLKGGGLAAAVPASPTITFALSDVVGDDPGTIASGPTVAAASPAEAQRILGRLDADVPAAVLAALEAGGRVRRRSGDAYTIVGGRTDAAAGAAAALRDAGVGVSVVSAPLEGEAAPAARNVIAAAGPHRATIHAGETTVTVSGDGNGGRNQEAALAAAIALDGSAGTTFLAAGTDGIDGTTEAAGAVVDEHTVPAAHRLGLEPEVFLARNDSGGFFATVPGQIVTGRTGTNVGDLWIVLRR